MADPCSEAVSVGAADTWGVLVASLSANVQSGLTLEQVIWRMLSSGDVSVEKTKNRSECPPTVLSVTPSQVESRALVHVCGRYKALQRLQLHRSSASMLLVKLSFTCLF